MFVNSSPQVLSNSHDDLQQSLQDAGDLPPKLTACFPPGVIWSGASGGTADRP